MRISHSFLVAIIIVGIGALVLTADSNALDFDPEIVKEKSTAGPDPHTVIAPSSLRLLPAEETDDLPRESTVIATVVNWLIATQREPAEADEITTDEEAARALERVLVTRGALLLPRYAREIEPELRYRYAGSAVQGTRRDTFTAALALRLGLPFDSQLELRIPYVIHDETTRDTTSGVGDIALLATKEVFRERDSLPNVLLSARWTAPTGNDQFVPDQLGTGSGFHVLEGLITASTRRDPLVFFGTAGYGVPLPETKLGVEVKPGSFITAKLGGILAASPETSLTAALNVAFSDRVSVAGRRIRGSDRVLGVLDLGVARIISSKALLSVTVEIGITDDAPDLGFVISLPLRF